MRELNTRDMYLDYTLVFSEATTRILLAFAVNKHMLRALFLDKGKYLAERNPRHILCLGSLINSTTRVRCGAPMRYIRREDILTLLRLS